MTSSIGKPVAHADNTLAAVERVVREFAMLPLESPARPDCLTGPLQLRSRLYHQVKTAWKITAERTEIARLVVEDVSASEARASLEARTRLELDHPAHGTFSTVIDLTGPVRLTRVGDEWKIADYCLDGRSSLDSYIHVERSVEQVFGVTVALRGLSLDTTITEVLLEWRSTRTAPVELVAGGLATRRLLPRWHWGAIDGEPQLLENGQAVSQIVWWVALPLETRDVWVVVHAREVASKTPYAFRFRVPLPALEERRANAGLASQ
ncbi:MAG TPA: hypothetical protein VF101_15265 [Gaiellaceae bacterium]